MSTGRLGAQHVSPYLDFFAVCRPYLHWRLDVQGAIATLTMSVDPMASVFDGCELKLNSYDIGVDLELADAVRRIRFEHPKVGCVVIASGLDGVYCAGANIRMLAIADHAHKVNFCKFTNETRLELEDASANSGLRFLAAVDGACTGGGYELALAADHILLVDDRNTAVALPEVPLLGVLPGTGGLTRLTDKRHVRRDRADVFATKSEGIRGQMAREWGLVDELAPRTDFGEATTARAESLARSSRAASPFADDEPVILAPLDISPAADGSVTGEFVAMAPDRERGCAEILITASADAAWPLRAARELDALLCHLRFNETALGTLVLLTQGRAEDVIVHDPSLCHPRSHAEHETALLWRRTLSRLDLMARSLVAALEPGSCFSGILAEIALASDRTYILDGVFEDERPAEAIGARVRSISRTVGTGEETAEPKPATLVVGGPSLGPMPMANGITRLRSRLWGDEAAIGGAEAAAGRPLDAGATDELGLATATPDDLDWDDDLRLAVEERAAFSPDALTAMEANHRFCGPETMATKIFGRLSAWQNWIFTRPNASGPQGSLSRYGSGTRPKYDPDRV